MSTSAPTPAAGGHKKRQRQMIIAGVALAGLMFLYLRSRSRPAAAAVVDPNAAATAQQPQVPAGGGTGPSTFADNGAQAASLGDAVTTGLSGMQQALADQTAALQQQQQAASTNGVSPPTSTSPTTINVFGPPPPPAPVAPPAASQAEAPRTLRFPAAPRGGGHYVQGPNGPQLIHATGHNHWAAGPPPRPPRGRRRRIGP